MLSRKSSRVPPKPVAGTPRRVPGHERVRGQCQRLVENQRVVDPAVRLNRDRARGDAVGDRNGQSRNREQQNYCDGEATESKYHLVNPFPGQFRRTGRDCAQGAAPFPRNCASECKRGASESSENVPETLKDSGRLGIPLRENEGSRERRFRFFGKTFSERL